MGKSIITVNKVTDFLRGIDNLVINIEENNIFLELLLENRYCIVLCEFLKTSVLLRSWSLIVAHCSSRSDHIYTPRTKGRTPEQSRAVDIAGCATIILHIRFVASTRTFCSRRLTD